MNQPTGTFEKSMDKAAEIITDPAGKQIPVISENAALKIAGLHKQTLKEVYIAAMGKNIWPLRYIRNHDSISLEDQKKLAGSRVAVIGAGGLGGYVIQLLARTGIGHLTIIDCDRFNESNLNRQILADTTAIGKRKVKIAASKIASINPATTIEAHPVRMTAYNAATLLHGNHLAIDALDNMETRIVLRNACQTIGIPLVHGAIAGFEGRVMSLFPNDHKADDIFSTSGEPSSEALIGTPAIAPAVIGSLQAMEALKILLSRGRIIKGRMLYVDLENATFDEFNF